jgi:hypothetical protein
VRPPNREADTAVCCDANDAVLVTPTVGEVRVDGAVGWPEQPSAVPRTAEHRIAETIVRMGMELTSSVGALCVPSGWSTSLPGWRPIRDLMSFVADEAGIPLECDATQPVTRRGRCQYDPAMEESLAPPMRDRDVLLVSATRPLSLDNHAGACARPVHVTVARHRDVGGLWIPCVDHANRFGRQVERVDAVQSTRAAGDSRRRDRPDHHASRWGARADWSRGAGRRRSSPSFVRAWDILLDMHGRPMSVVERLAAGETQKTQRACARRSVVAAASATPATIGAARAADVSAVQRCALLTPSTLLFADADTARAFPETREKVRQLELVRRSAALYRSSPQPVPGPEMLESIRAAGVTLTGQECRRTSSARCVQGDDASGYRTYIWLDDVWLRRKRIQHLARSATKAAAHPACIAPSDVPRVCGDHAKDVRVDAQLLRDEPIGLGRQLNRRTASTENERSEIQ